MHERSQSGRARPTIVNSWLLIMEKYGSRSALEDRPHNDSGKPLTFLLFGFRVGAVTISLENLIETLASLNVRTKNNGALNI